MTNNNIPPMFEIIQEAFEIINKFEAEKGHLPQFIILPRKWASSGILKLNNVEVKFANTTKISVKDKI